jgi:TonB family protein
MIARTLVPPDTKPLSVSRHGAGARQYTELDARKLIPAGLSVGPLEERSNIPSYMPLDVLAARQLVPRDLPVKPLDTSRKLSPYIPLEVLAPSIAVPKDAKPPEISPQARRTNPALSDVLEPDVLTTGEVNLLAQPAPALRDEKKWVLRGMSAVLHALALLMIVMISSMVPAHQVTQAEIDRAARQLDYLYMPPDFKMPGRTASPPPVQSPRLRIDPKFLHQIEPPKPAPLQGPITPPTVTRDETKAPPSESIAPPVAPHMEAPKPLMSVPPATTTPPATGLKLPNFNTGSAIRDSEESLARNHGGGETTRGFGTAIGGGGGYGGNGGGGQGYGALQMLTPTEGVDFSSYLDRVVASVKRNWEAVMPESARMGERGRVILQFRIFRDGTVVNPEPYLVGTSGKEPLDRAAASAIRASSPFEPLPPAFSGPYIELRFIFLYNLPLSAANQ